MHFNIHTDFVDESVRQAQVRVFHEQILQKVVEEVSLHSHVSVSNCVVMITGDFNSLRFGPSWHELMNSSNSNSGGTTLHREGEEDDADTALPVPVSLYVDYVDNTALEANVRESKTYFSFHGFLGDQIESWVYAITLSTAFTVLQFLSQSTPGMNNIVKSAIRASFSLDFHVDWIVLGSIKQIKQVTFDACSEEKMLHNAQCTSDQDDRGVEMNQEDGIVSIHSHKTIVDSSPYFRDVANTDSCCQYKLHIGMI